MNGSSQPMAWRSARGVWSIEVDGDRPAAPPHRDVRGVEHRGQEPVDIFAAADGGAHVVDLRRDRPGVEGVLGEPRTARLLAVAGVLPLGMNRLHLHVELVDEVEGELTHVSRIGETTYRSALPEGYRYGNRSVRDWTEGRHFSVIVMHFGACQGGTHARTMARQV